ncbi:MAG: hypothetical protein ACE5JB_01915 [bacterium]
MKAVILLIETARVGSPILGVIIPGVILIISLVLTWMLYRHFSRK